MKSLIAARGVCLLWRTSVASANLHPTRRKLLDLYLRVMRSRAFLATRRHILPHLVPFDRQEFLADLPATTPEEFQTWILEWPARAIFEWIWPGLPGTCPYPPIFPDIMSHGDHNALPNDPTQRLRLFNPDNGESLWTFEGLPYKSEIWSGAAHGLQEMEVELLPLTSRAGRFFPSKLEFFGLVVSSPLKSHQMNSVVYWSEAFNTSEEIPGGWVEFLTNDLDRQEVEASEDQCVTLRSARVSV